MPEQVIVIGGGGHAKVVIDCIESAGDTVIGILDDGLKPGSTILEIPVLGKVSEYSCFADKHFIIAIGSNVVRRRIAQSMDVRWYTAIHPKSVISRYAEIGEGSVVMANAAVNAGAVIGRHCIINTASIVEHDNRIEDYVHISPNASLGGTVYIGETVHIGIGAAVKNNISICSGCTVGAGAVVVKNLVEPGVYIGIPSKELK